MKRLFFLLALSIVFLILSLQSYGQENKITIQAIQNYVCNNTINSILEKQTTPSFSNIMKYEGQHTKYFDFNCQREKYKYNFKLSSFEHKNMSLYVQKRGMYGNEYKVGIRYNLH